MKAFFILTTFLLSNQVLAQKALDTIYANEDMNVTLFFPKPIRQGIVGNDNFVFTYNREEQQYFGLLQAQHGAASNLLAITNDGQVYSYILKYSKELPKLNYFVQETQSIGNERPLAKIVEPIKSNSISSEKDYYTRACNYLLKSKGESIAIKRKKGMKLKLQKMAYYGSEVFLVMEISNRSGIDFEIDYLKVSRVNGNKKKRSSHQKLEMGPVFVHQAPEIIRNNQAQRFVYVLPKLVLGDDERFEIELQERNGARFILLSNN